MPFLRYSPAVGNVLELDCLFVSKFCGCQHSDTAIKTLRALWLLQLVSVLFRCTGISTLLFSFIERRAKYLPQCQRPPETADNLIRALWTPGGIGFLLHFCSLVILLLTCVLTRLQFNPSSGLTFSTLRSEDQGQRAAASAGCICWSMEALLV